MCVVAGMCLRQNDLPDLRRERNRSLSRQWVMLNKGVEDRNNQRLKTRNAVFQLPTSALHQILTCVGHRHFPRFVHSHFAWYALSYKTTFNRELRISSFPSRRDAATTIVVANAFLWIAAQRNSVDDRSRSGSGKQAIYLQRPPTRVG
jgi:hypothetical protein